MPPSPKVYNVVDTKGPNAGKVRAVVGEKALAVAVSGPTQARLEADSEALGRASAAGEEARYSGLGSKLAGYGERFVDSASVGLLPLVRGALGNKYDREDLAGRRKATEGTFGTVIDIAGAAAPALLTGGESLAADVASATPAGALSTATAALGRTGEERLVAGRVAAGLTKEAAEAEVAAAAAKRTAFQRARQAAVDTARVGAAAGVEGAVYTTGDHLAAVGRGEEDLNAEAILADAAKGGGVTALLGGAFHGTSEVIGAGRKFIKGDKLVRKGAGGDVAKLADGMDGAVRDSLVDSAEMRDAIARKLHVKAIEDKGLAAAARARLVAAKAAKADAQAGVEQFGLDELAARRRAAAPKAAVDIPTAKSTAAPENVAVDVTEKNATNDAAMNAAIDRAAPKVAKGSVPVDASVPVTVADQPPLAGLDLQDDPAWHTPDPDTKMTPFHKALADVDPEAARLYKLAEDSASADMAVRERWQVYGKHVRDDAGGKASGPPLNLTLSELADETPGRIRAAMKASNPAEQKAILEALGPWKARQVLRGRFGVFGDSEGRLGGEWFLPEPKAGAQAVTGTERATTRPGGFTQDALDDLVAKRGGVQAPVQTFDEAGEAVPTPIAKGSQATAREAPGELSRSMEPSAPAEAIADNATSANRAGLRDMGFDLSDAEAEGVANQARIHGITPEQADDLVLHAGLADTVGVHDQLFTEAADALGADAPLSVQNRAAAYADAAADQSRRSMAQIARHAEDAPVLAKGSQRARLADQGYDISRGFKAEMAGPRNPLPDMLPPMGGLRDRMRRAGWDAERFPDNPPIAADDILAQPSVSRDTATYEREVAAKFGPPAGPPKVGLPRNPARRAQMLAETTPESVKAATVANSIQMPVAGELGQAAEVVRQPSGYAGVDIRAARDAAPRIAQADRAGMFRRMATSKADDAFADSPWSAARPRKPFAAAEAPAKGGFLSTLANVGTGLEALQAVGVHTPFDPDKIPLVGPLLGPLLKLRGAMMAARRFGILAPATGHALTVARSVAVRNTMIKTVDRLLATGQKAARVGVSVAANQGWRMRDVLDRPISPEAMESAKRKKMTDAEAVLASSAEARALAANPEAVAAAVRRSLPPDVDPDLVDAATAAKQRQVEYLAKYAVVEPPRGIFSGSKWVASLGEQVKYTRRLRAATDPTTVYEDILAGTLTSEAVDAFKNVYPSLYQETQAYLVGQAAEIQTKLGPDQVAQLSALFGVALRPTLGADEMTRLQMADAPPPAQAAGGAPQGPGVGLPSGGPAPLATAYDPNAAYRPPGQ